MGKKSISNKPVQVATDVYILKGSGALVTPMSESIGLTSDKSSTKDVSVGKTEYKFVNRGSTNKLPHEVIEKAKNNVIVGPNLGFLAQMAFGVGIQVMKRDENDKLIHVPRSQASKVYEWLDEQNYNLTAYELATDIVSLGDGFVEIIMSTDGNQIAEINHLDNCCSRVTQMESGEVKYHGFSSKWSNPDEDLVVTPMLKKTKPLLHLKQLLGEAVGPNKKKEKSEAKRYVLQLSVPSPGRFYYSRPDWWSVFESGWFDYSAQIIKIKNAIIKNKVDIKYHVEINKEFWSNLFDSEGITDEKKQKEKKTEVLKQINDFLTGNDNARKSFISHFNYSMIKGVREQDVIITPINNKEEGGEYIADSEESSNMLCYAMGVHPSLLGAAPGKNKTLNGSEAREIFTLKQALMHFIRVLLVTPLYLAKHANKWDENIEFHIANIQLTTLDKGTGSVKQIGNQEVN